VAQDLAVVFAGIRARLRASRRGRRLVCPAERSSASGVIAHQLCRIGRKTDRNHDYLPILDPAVSKQAAAGLAPGPPRRGRLGLRVHREIAEGEKEFFRGLFRRPVGHLSRNRFTGGLWDYAVPWEDPHPNLAKDPTLGCCTLELFQNSAVASECRDGRFARLAGGDARRSIDDCTDFVQPRSPDAILSGS
jgi:hypothetical protein